MSDGKNSFDSVFSLINVMDNLNPEEKGELRKDCEFAIRQFGEGWLDREDTKGHPLRGFIGNSIGLCELGELGSALRSLQSQKYFPPIIDRLKNPDQFEGAYSEILVGHWLKKSGVNFEFIYEKKNSAPDIRIISHDRDSCMEITTKQYSPDYLKAHQIYSRFSNTLLFNSKGLRACAVTHRPLTSSAHADAILSACEKMMVKAEHSGFEEYHLNNVIDVYFLHPENLEKVPVKHRTFSFQMPKTDEYSRVRGTIRDKVRQLNHNTPGILLIFDQHFWPFDKIGKFASQLRHELEESIFEAPNLSAVIIINRYGITTINERNSIRKSENSIAMKTIDHKSNVCRFKVVIFNKFAKFPLNDEEIKILKRI